jgi:hypothetical protein
MRKIKPNDKIESLIGKSIVEPVLLFDNYVD